MNRKTIGRISTIALLLGTATVACTPGSHVASVSEKAVPPRGGTQAPRYAEAAKAAIAKHKGADAVKAAEKAVAFQPGNADYRMVLGQAYLVSGRFASAETAFRDSLQLSPEQPRTSFNLALAEIAQNKSDAARDTLKTLDGKVPDSDLGLAMALAGDRTAGIDKLTAIIRAGKSDARTRQNLALACALDGRWNEARGMAMQDTPPQRINDQLAEWAQLAKPGQAGTQIAKMLGTAPAASDPGLPTRLALAAPTRDAPMALALAAPEAPAAAAPAAFEPAVPAPVSPVRQVALTLEAPAAAPAPAVMPAMLAAPDAPAKVVAAPEPVAPPPLIRASAKPMRVAAAEAPKSVAPGPELMAVRQGGFVVQLGAFAHGNAIDAAWSKAAALTPNMVNFTPVRGSTSLSGATLVRISVGGFKTRGDAASLCTQLKARGQACFVRGVGNDAPLQWVRKDNGKVLQLAAIKPKSIES